MYVRMVRMHVRKYVCMYVCVSVCSLLVTDTRTLCMATCLSCGVAIMAAPLTQLMTGGDQAALALIGLASQQWGYIMHTHHTMHETVLAPGPRTQVPAIVHGPSTLPARPKFKACKSVTQHPLAGLGGTSHGGLGRPDRQFTGLQVCSYVIRM